MKFNYSGVQLFVRFDKRLEVASAADEGTKPVNGFPDILLQDLPHKVPVTSFSFASCLREGLVRIHGRVVEAKAFSTKGSAAEVGKAILEEVTPDGTKWQAELIGFDASAGMVAALEVDGTYDFFGLAVQSQYDKNGFAFKWVRHGEDIIRKRQCCSRRRRGKSEDVVRRRFGGISWRPCISTGLFSGGINLGEHFASDRCS